jgi:hypothetical protein
MSFYEEVSLELGYRVEPGMTLAEWVAASEAQWREEWK